jgi:hypothetical protein
MALEAPLRSSTGSIISSFSPHTDMSISSPDSPAIHSQQFRPMYVSGPSLQRGNALTPVRSTSSVDASSLRPSSAAAARASSISSHLMSPSDIVGPSPVTSVGTEVTEIEDEASDDARIRSASPDAGSPRQVYKSHSHYMTICGEANMSIATDAEDQYLRPSTTDHL